MRCHCGFEAKSGAGLAAHRRACRDEPAVETVSVAGSVEDQVSALRATARTLAVALDRSESPRDLPALARELRATLERIEVLSEDVGQDDRVDELAALRRMRKSAS